MYDILTVVEEARKTIEKKGFATITSPRLSKDGQICAHTLGMPAQGLPDLVVFIPEQGTDIASMLLNEVANLQIAQGKYAHGRVLRKDVFPDIPPESSVNLTLLEVNNQHLQEIFVLNKVLLRDKTYTQEAFQITYPDDKGRYPWMPGSDLASLRIVSRPLE